MCPPSISTSSARKNLASICELWGRTSWHKGTTTLLHLCSLREGQMYSVLMAGDDENRVVRVSELLQPLRGDEVAQNG